MASAASSARIRDSTSAISASVTRRAAGWPGPHRAPRRRPPQLGVGVHLPEDLGLLLLGRVLDQVCDLRGLQPPDRPNGPRSHGALRMADKRLEPGPVPECRRAPAPPRPATARAVGAACGGYPPPQAPISARHGTAAQLKVGRPHQVGGLPRRSACGPSMSARSSTSPSRRSNRRRSILALVSLSTSPSKGPTARRERTPACHRPLRPGR